MDQRRRDVGGKFCISGKTFHIYGGVNPIGRNKEAVVNIKSLGVSQQHAQFILVDDDLHFISDLKSSNGTFLNNKKIKPLQLYRLDNGSRIKFADIEGIYSKLMLNDVEHQGNLSIINENTQNFTQNFYGSDTQIMDKTNSMIQHDKSSAMTNYIPSQVLADVAEEMENSYIQAHEQPTQVISTFIEEMDNKSIETKNSINITDNKSDITGTNNFGSTFHEAATQVIENDEEGGSSFDSMIALHEAETQIVDQESSIAQQNISLQEVNMHEAVLNLREKESLQISTDPVIERVDSQEVSGNNSCQLIIRTTPEQELTMNTGDRTPHLAEESSQTTQDIDVVNPQGISDNIMKDTQNSAIVLATQENDIVNPVGISSNVIEDTQISQEVSENVHDSRNSFSGLDFDSLDDSDIIRPVKKSINIFESQDSSDEEDIEEPCEMMSNDPSSVNVSKPGCSNISKTSPNDTKDGIQPVKKSTNVFESQDSEGIEEDSNDSVDFMTMQKISNTEKYVEADNQISLGNGRKDRNISEPNDSDGSETDLENEKPLKNFIQMDDGSETEEEDFERKNNQKMVKNRVSNNIKVDIDNKEVNEVRRKSKRVKKNIVFSDSGSDTDVEIEDKKSNKPLVKVLSACSDSDTDIENIDQINRYAVIDKVNEKKNESVGLILEESALEEEIKVQENTNIKEDIPPNKNACNRLSVGYNESLNDSDFIPPTQDENVKSISQNSKFENSENSFKLGLTQMEEEDASQKDKQSQTPSNSENNQAENQKSSQSASSQDTQKKFVFKKSSLGITESANITLDYEDDIYQAKTQNICEEKESKLNNSTDGHVFLQPTQEAPKRIKHNVSESIPDDDIYLLSTQRLDGTSKKNDVDDFYQQSTQKLIMEDSSEQRKTAELRLSGNEFYNLPTQKLPEKEDIENLSKETEHNDSKEDDIFATQVMDLKGSPHKYLESELEHMFATQRAVPTEDSLDKIQDIVLKKQIIDDKLPAEDKDLEAILCTQKMIDSPKRSKPLETFKSPGKSIESQLEVLFASQTCDLPPDKFVRPPNPLVNIFGDSQDTQELLKDFKSPDNDKKTNEHDESESSLRQKKTCKTGLEQSFALLEAKSTKIRRSDRNKTCEEVSVSCPKSRVSMIVAPNDKVILEEDSKPIKVKNTRTSRKRQPPESTITNARKKKMKISEETNSSDEENQSNVPSASSRENITNKILSRIREIEDEQDNKSSVKIIERPPTPSKKRSSRMTKVKTEESTESTTNEYAKTYKTRTSRVKKTSEPCNSNNNIKDSMKSEVSAITKSKSNKSNEEIVEKSSKPRSSKITDNNGVKDKKTKNEKDVNEGEVDNKSKDLEEKKTSRTRTSKVTKTTVQSKDQSRNKEKEPSNNIEKKNQSSSDAYENDETAKIDSINKLKENVKRQTTPSRTLKRGTSIQVTTPPKIQRVSEATPSSSRRRINVDDTPNRNKRKLKPKVVFTMMEDPQLESQIKQLGGSVVESVDSCTVLITKFVKRTMKLLSAVGLGKPICSEEWVKRSKKENDFLDPWDFVLVDKEAEKKWNFSLKTSLERSLEAKLFEGYTFQLLVTNAQDVLKGAIESCGGKIVSRVPKGANNFVVVAVPEQKDKYKKLLKQHSNLTVVEPEAIFDGVLRQEIRFEKHSLK